MTLKHCYVCGQDLHIADFYPANFGLMSKCKKCHNNQMKQYRLDNKERLKEKDRERHKLKRQTGQIQAKHALLAYMRTNSIKRPTMCEVCGKIGLVDAHHENYSKPLDVEWLCKQCHKDKHAK